MLAAELQIGDVVVLADGGLLPVLDEPLVMHTAHGLFDEPQLQVGVHDPSGGLCVWAAEQDLDVRRRPRAA